MWRQATRPCLVPGRRILDWGPVLRSSQLTMCLVRGEDAKRLDDLVYRVASWTHGAVQTIVQVDAHDTEAIRQIKWYPRVQPFLLVFRNGSHVAGQDLKDASEYALTSFLTDILGVPTFAPYDDVLEEARKLEDRSMTQQARNLYYGLVLHDTSLSLWRILSIAGLLRCALVEGDLRTAAQMEATLRVEGAMYANNTDIKAALFRYSVAVQRESVHQDTPVPYMDFLNQIIQGDIFYALDHASLVYAQCPNQQHHIRTLVRSLCGIFDLESPLVECYDDA